MPGIVYTKNDFQDDMSDILKAAEAYSKAVLSKELSKELVYHSLDHTRDVVNSVKEIASG